MCRNKKAMLPTELQGHLAINTHCQNRLRAEQKQYEVSFQFSY
jgi:hypothetical protein